MECKECNGSKWAIDETFMDGTATIKDCPACNGTGQEAKHLTHEELLTKIDAITGLSYNAETNVVTYGNPHGQHRFIVNQALRAVVELHKPEPETFESSLICEGCTQGAFVRLTAYPCPTIQAIEKELK